MLGVHNFIQFLEPTSWCPDCCRYFVLSRIMHHLLLVLAFYRFRFRLQILAETIAHVMRAAGSEPLSRGRFIQLAEQVQ